MATRSTPKKTAAEPTVIVTNYTKRGITIRVEDDSLPKDPATGLHHLAAYRLLPGRNRLLKRVWEAAKALKSVKGWIDEEMIAAKGTAPSKKSPLPREINDATKPVNREEPDDDGDDDGDDDE